MSSFAKNNFKIATHYFKKNIYIIYYTYDITLFCIKTIFKVVILY